jgi:hypothetical protein
MIEAELQENVIKTAHLLGWRVAHFRPAQNARGDWRTPVAADGKGFPDLCLASQGRVLFIECKSDIGKLSDDQYTWSVVLGKSLFTVVRPRDWHSGRVERMLRSGHIEE